MKTLRTSSIALLIMGIFFFAKPSEAQVDTSKSCSGESCCISQCFSKGSFSSKSFGGPMASATATGLGGELAFGGGGGLLFDCGFYVGAYGKGSSVARRSPAFSGKEMNIETGYGGLMIGGHPFKNKVVHPKWGLQLGYGSIEGVMENYVDGEHDLTVMDDDIFVIKPDLGVGFNICSSLVLDISGGYRFVKGMNVDDQLRIGSKDLNGFQGSIGMKFTGF